MTAILPRPEGAPTTVSGKSAASQRRLLDCEVCVVGDGLAARLLAYRLAALGRHVVHVVAPDDEALPLDPVLAPGFALPARALVDRLGQPDAAELIALSHDAATRGRDLLTELGVSPGPKGALLAARPHAAERLKQEQEILARIAPGVSRLIGPRDLEDLLGTRAFAAAIGLVPALRLNGAELAVALAGLAAAAGVREVPAAGPLACDVNGLRKYVDADLVRVRAFEVVLCGAAAIRAGAPQMAGDLVPTHCAAGRMALAPVTSGAALPPFAGRVQAFGGTGLAYQLDEAGLALAVETAWLVRMSWSAGRVLRHQARRLVPAGLTGAVEGARGHDIIGTRHRMPMVGRLGKGVWVAGALGPQAASVHLMAADLLADAIVHKDDRIALLRPFLALEPKPAFAVLRDMASYWRERLAARMARPPEGGPGLPAPRIPESDGAPVGRGSPPARARARTALRPAAGAERPVPGPARQDARQRPKDGT